MVYDKPPSMEEYEDLSGIVWTSYLKKVDPVPVITNSPWYTLFTTLTLLNPRTSLSITISFLEESTKFELIVEKL